MYSNDTHVQHANPETATPTRNAPCYDAAVNNPTDMEVEPIPDTTANTDTAPAAGQPTKEKNAMNNNGKQMDEWQKKAEAGDAEAQYKLGLAFMTGDGVPIDMKEAVKWNTLAAKNGDAPAQNNLGVCYMNGWGVPKDMVQAVEWWRRAAKQDHPISQFNLSMSYFNGDGAPKNLKEAVKWCTRAAKNGDADAQNRLGVCYEMGIGVPKNLKTAQKWYTRAAEQGDVKAQCNLGMSRFNGDGVWAQSMAENAAVPVPETVPAADANPECGGDSALYEDTAKDTFENDASEMEMPAAAAHSDDNGQANMNNAIELGQAAAREHASIQHEEENAQIHTGTEAAAVPDGMAGRPAIS